METKMTTTRKEKKVREIVRNDCFGGFGLSDEAFELYLQKKNLKYYKYDSLFGGSTYYKVPKEKYDRLQEKWRKEDGDYRRINAKGWFLNDRDIERDDPLLIEVVRQLKKKANGRYADLKIVKVPVDVEYEIDEYDGLETIREKHRTW